jgi:hypothetical protein
MNPKILNYSALAFVLGLSALGGYSLYDRGRQAERAANAEEALADSTQAYTQRERHLKALLRADSAAEATRVALREPVEPAITHYVTLRDTLQFTDTLLIEAADEAVTTCSLALLACEARVATSDSVRVTLESQVRNLEAQLRAREVIAEASCSGTVPTWMAVGGMVVSAGVGAWVRGQD